MVDRQNWKAIKEKRADTHTRREAYNRAKEAYDLGQRVRRARERLGMTQADLAARTGTTQPAVARLEAGGVTPSLETLHRVADGLGLELVVDLRRPRRASA